MTEFFGALKLVYNILVMAKNLYEIAQANKDEEWFKNMTRITEGLTQAKSPEDIKKIGQDLARNWGKM